MPIKEERLLEYLITFLEGFISFISPCMLPMIPIYVSYFAGGSAENKKSAALINSLFFVLGFTLVFISMGLFAGVIGAFLIKYHRIVSIVCGVIVIIFGLNFIGIFKFNFFRGVGNIKQGKGIFSSLLFGIVFSISLTPCTGAFLGSALMMASDSASAFNGAILLAAYSAGLGVPLVISAVLLDKLKSAFDFIKRNYKTINIICGGFLIAVGLSMVFGLFELVLSLLT